MSDGDPILKLALLGRNISYSVSPELHRLLFTVLPKDHTSYRDIQYDILDLPDEDSATHWLVSARSNGYVGCNITVPYKHVGATVADELRGVATVLGSGNTISFVQGSAVLISTDGKGLLAALDREMPEFRTGKIDMLLIGAGGAAASVVQAFSKERAIETLTVAARDPSKAKRVLNLSQAPVQKVLTIADLPTQLLKTNGRFRVIIQATPLSRSIETTWDLPFTKSDLAIDLVYDPLQTSFLRTAQSQGARTMNGLGMLIEQAAFSQYFWRTGEETITSPLTRDQYFQIKESLHHLIAARHA